MDEKVEILLNKINIDKEHYQYFSDAKMSKIKINSHTNNWNIFIEKETLLPLEIYEELEEKKNLLDPKAEEIRFIFDIKNIFPLKNVELEDLLLPAPKDPLTHLYESNEY